MGVLDHLSGHYRGTALLFWCQQRNHPLAVRLQLTKVLDGLYVLAFNQEVSASASILVSA